MENWTIIAAAPSTIVATSRRDDDNDDKWKTLGIDTTNGTRAHTHTHAHARTAVCDHEDVTVFMESRGNTRTEKLRKMGQM